MHNLNKNYINKIVKQALEEDLKPFGDITSKKIENIKSKAKIIAKENGVISGLEFCEFAFKLTGKEVKFLKKVKDGEKVKKGKILATISARARTILSAERTALNFLSHASGISTLTNKFVSKTNNKTKICCTRKTTPNLRVLEKYAVRKGGGFNHRYNLSHEIMIKDNHIKVEKSLNKIIKKTINTGKTVTVEIDNISQLKKIMGLKFKRILFDNMNLSDLKKCLKICGKKYDTEYSGNVTLKNISKFSKTNINRISIGSLTHSAKALDISLDIV